MKKNFFIWTCLLIAVTVGTAGLSETLVVDGDTIDVDGIRYHINDIDVPEHGQEMQRALWRMAMWKICHRGNGPAHMR